MFDVVQSVNTCAIFSLLPVNSVVLGLSMYTIENVKLLFHWSRFEFIPQFVCFLFNLQSEFDMVLFVIDIVCVICALIWCSLYCNFADMASERLSSIGDAAFSADWYNYPLKWQKYFILMIERSQKPVHFKGLNVINCTLEVFVKVKPCNTFLMFVEDAYSFHRFLFYSFANRHAHIM